MALLFRFIEMRKGFQREHNGKKVLLGTWRYLGKDTTWKKVSLSF
jgi:hypothetical protein